MQRQVTGPLAVRRVDTRSDARGSKNGRDRRPERDAFGVERARLVRARGGSLRALDEVEPEPERRPASACLWLAEVRALRADSRERRRARIDAAARAGVVGVHATDRGNGAANLCGATHVDLATRAAELGLLYGVVPKGPREVSLTQPWADYYLFDADLFALHADLAVELARSGKEIWLRAAATANATRSEAALHGAIDQLVERGCRRLVVLAGDRGAVVALRRTTGLAVGWNDAVGDADGLSRVHTELGVRHFVVRLELEGQGREGTGFDPSAVSDLRARLEHARRAAIHEDRRPRRA